MENWQKEVIIKAFKRDFGLRESLKFLDSSNKAFRDVVIPTLSERTGLSTKFIEINIEKIKLL